MNRQDQISKIVDQYVELLPSEDNAQMLPSEAKATRFLLAIAKLSAVRDELLNAKIKKDSLRTVAYRDAFNNAPGSNAQAREANAEADPTYLASNEDVALIDNQVLYIKTMIDVFNNAHILYRGLMKGEIQ